MLRSVASSALSHATPTLACGCDAHMSIPVLLALRSQSFEVSRAWVLDSTCRPCLSNRMLAIIYVLGERGCFFLRGICFNLWSSSRLATGRLSAGRLLQRQLYASFVLRMWSTRSVISCLALQLTAVAGAINHDAEPYVIAMVNNASMGPDGMYAPDCCKSTC